MPSSKAPSMRDREVRLGIVLYGGVSLAVYENGVAQELFRAVKGEGVYGLIKDLTDSDIVVDIISGTSAGGINGIMLGYALANNKDFKNCAKLWREDGDILQLLRNPNQPDPNSLLDSEGYYQERLKSCYESMPAYVRHGNAVSEIDELDLFVTSTDVQGSVFTEFDDQGHPIDVKNHRQVFVLSYREGRKNEFQPGRSAALAKLSRLTSCFPVAFAPVKVEPDGDDDLLGVWGRLNDGRERLFFLDGGVLNNKPFSYTIDAIARRTADRDVDRMLFYVEPDPERFDPELAKKEAAKSGPPDVVDAAVDALVAIPGYQSISSDLQSIAARNDRVQQFLDLAACLPDNTAVPDCFNDEPGDGLATLPADPRLDMYRTARLEQLRTRAVEGILREAGAKKLLRDKGERHAAKILVESFEQWKGGNKELSPEQQAAVAYETLNNFDVYYRKRRLLHLSYRIQRKLYPAEQGRKPAPLDHPYRKLWRRLNHQFKILEMIQFAAESAIDQAPIPWKDLAGKEANPDNAIPKWLMAQNVLLAVLDSKGIESHKGGADKALSDDDLWDRRKEFMGALNRRVEASKVSDPAKDVRIAGNLLHDCDRIERDILRQFAPDGEKDEISREYCRFLIVDSYLFPMRRLADMESTDLIHTVRISPIDAQREYSKRTLDAKLCGNELGHFGGFMKRSWRANDIMWGRLDAVCQLIECLLTKERIWTLGARQAPKPERLREIFPHSDADAIADLHTRISNVHSLGDDEEKWDQFWDALTRAAQKEILEDELPTVVAAAIGQHAAWNQFEVQTKFDKEILSKNQVWKVGPRQIDPLVTSYAAAKLAGETPAPQGWVAWFENYYAVGSETWTEAIPKPILVEVMAQAAMVFRTCLLKVAGPRAKDISGNLLYQALVNWPLIVAYKFVRLQRTAPEYVWATAAALVVASIAALVVDYVFIKEIFAKGSWTVVIVPALVLLIVSTLTLWFSRAPRNKDLS